MRRPELLAPASCPEVLHTAVLFGADAVYIGGESFGLRAKAKNFTLPEMAEGIKFAHAHGVKVYVTVNIFAHNRDLDELESYLKNLGELKPDALLIADPGVFSMAKRICPKIELHISTQANITNYESCRFWQALGAKRVVAARELSLEELKELKDEMPEGMELEAFVHGAMCISYSGRCLLSNYFTGKDANQGECTHPCRWKYAVMEETRPGEYLPLEENERGSFLFNSKDLCMIEHIPDLINAGIDSLKIEGRMKNALYVATVTRAYRRAIDDYLKDPALYNQQLSWYREQVSDCTYRPFTTGFFYGKPGQEAQIYEGESYSKGYTYLGMVKAAKPDISGEGWQIETEQRNKFSVGETIEIMQPDGSDLETTVLGICDENGSGMEDAPHPKQKLWVRIDCSAEKDSIIRRKEEQTLSFDT